MPTKKIFLSIVITVAIVLLIMYRFGVFNKTELTPNNEDKNINKECVKAGCSGELCVKAELADQIASTCEYREEYGCYQKATCTLQEDGGCGFTQTPELIECLKNANSSPQLRID